MNTPYYVCKFGSSVLESPKDITRVSQYIEEYVRSGQKTVVVVSAFAGETDTLFKNIDTLGLGMESPNAARFIALGELKSATLLALALDANGVSNSVKEARDISLIASGPDDDASPQSLDLNLLLSSLQENDCVIVPGYAAIGRDGHDKLLGRGGSDLTALFLAKELGCAAVTLLKDVDGVYDLDPNLHNNAKRFKAISWQDARRVSEGLIQDKTLVSAREHGLGLEIRSMNTVTATYIHGNQTQKCFWNDDA